MLLLVLLALLPHALALGPQDSQQIVNTRLKLETPVWPEQFYAQLFQNRSHALALTQLYYDWPKQRNVNIITSQLGARGVVWDLEYGNGTSFIFSRQEPLCKVLHFDVGILRPNWLENATLVGEDTADTFDVHVWTKADFITYMAEVDSQQPVRWTFLGSGAQFHVLTYEPGATLPAKQWQAPAYCFSPGNNTGGDFDFLEQQLATGDLFRMPTQQQPAAGGGSAPQRAAAKHAAVQAILRRARQ